MEPDVMSAIIGALVVDETVQVMPVFRVHDGPYQATGLTGRRDVVYLRHPTNAIYRIEVSRHA